MSNASPEFIKTRIGDLLREVGFDAVGFTLPEALTTEDANLQAYLKAGHHGTMTWLEDRAKKRASPKALWPEVKSIAVAASNYGPSRSPEDLKKRTEAKSKATISVYAQNKDYHDLMKKRLKRVGRQIHQEFGADLKVFVDTAPVMEKPLAAAAGLGWQGKHTNLVSRDFGSWLFLGAIYLSIEVPADELAPDLCGSCTACLDACPTNAFPAPGQIDARRCISYLTIELKEEIPEELRKDLGNRVYGCDDCLTACPWNKFTKVTEEPAFQPRKELEAPDLKVLSRLNDAEFRTHFSGSPVKRIKRDRFLRNLLIAMGNSEDTSLIEEIRLHLKDSDPVVSATANWALHQLTDED